MYIFTDYNMVAMAIQGHLAQKLFDTELCILYRKLNQSKLPAYIICLIVSQGHIEYDMVIGSYMDLWSCSGAI